MFAKKAPFIDLAVPFDNSGLGTDGPYRNELQMARIHSELPFVLGNLL